jgi:peptidoglycan/xylan/chitin deacetylase (PgdA/CDA1 family)
MRRHDRSLILPACPSFRKSSVSGGGSPMPDIPNWAWHEYGNRVGFWRFVEVFDALAIPAVLAINGSALAAYPPIVRAAHERNREFIGHGFTQRNMQKVEDERADIRKTRDAIAKAIGKPPRGWLGPGLRVGRPPTFWLRRATTMWLTACSTNQPVWLKTRTRPIVNVPYTHECNDVAMMLIQHHKALRSSPRRTGVGTCLLVGQSRDKRDSRCPLWRGLCCKTRFGCAKNFLGSLVRSSGNYVGGRMIDPISNGESS